MRIIRKELAYHRGVAVFGREGLPGSMCMYIYIHIWTYIYMPWSKLVTFNRTWHIWPIIHIVFLTYKPLDLILQNYGNGLLLFSTIHSSLNGEVWECFFSKQTHKSPMLKSERLSDLSLRLSLSHLSVCNHIPFLHLRISQLFLLFGCVSRFLC